MFLTFPMARSSSLVVVLCFTMAMASNVTARDTVQLQHLATTTAAKNNTASSSLLSLPEKPAASVAADAMWGATGSKNTHSTLELPQLSTARPQNDGTSQKPGTQLQQKLLSTGQQLLTPGALANSMQQGKGINIQDTVTAIGTKFSQDVIDASLKQAESKLSSSLFRTINLNWSPGFNGRKSIYQLDGMMSLHDDRVSSLMSQVGVQSRDGKPAANVGMILRTGAFKDWSFGVNAFYDYLSDPKVDRWSAGTEIYGRWFNISANAYTGLGKDVVAGQTRYSPDGWDVEVAGRIEQLPWLEYSGRYYRWNKVGAKDLKGQDYKLTLKPVPLLDVSLRYDDASGTGGKFGVEAQLKYEFGTSLNEQTSSSNVSVPSDPWQRRFERVRREYEQRVQSRATGSSVIQVGNAVCVGARCEATFRVSNAPTGTTQLAMTITGRTGRTTGTAPALSSANNLLRVSRNCDMDASAVIPRQLRAANCDYSSSTIVVSIIQTDLGLFSYNLNVSFQNDSARTLGSVPTTMVVNVTDPRALVSSEYVLTVNEGGSASYTVVLNSMPTADVTLTLSSDDSNVMTTPTLIFTTSNWNMEQKVTVTAAEDDNTANETVQLSYTATGGSNYDDFELPVQSVIVTDNDVAGVTSTAGTTLTVTEGNAVSYDLILNTQPSADVTIALTSSNPQAVTVMSSSMTFARSSWDRARTITVTAVEDDNAIDETVSISYEVSGGDYGSVTMANQRVAVTDNDTVGITSTGGDTISVTEGGTNSYTLVLDTQPAGTVTITLTSSNTTITVSPNLITFNQNNWNQLQPVAIAGVQDTDVESETAQITYNVSGYGNANLTPQAVTVIDDDMATLSITPTTIAEASGTATMTLNLSGGTLRNNLVVTLNAVSGTATVGAIGTASSALGTADVALAAATATILAGESSTQFTVNLNNDDIAEGTESFDISMSTNTENVEVRSPVTVSITDDDTGGITSTGGASVAVTEGSEASYTLVLTSQPADTVTIELTSSDTSAVTVNSPISFSTTDWNTAKTVTLTGEEDGDIAGESVTISYGISGGDYDSVTLEAQRVAVTDNDTGGITSTGGASVAVTEGSEATYELVLTVAPTGPVTITLTSDDTGAVTVTPMITFDASDWNTMKTVTVTAEDDADPRMRV